jgi:acetyl-CoA synthetase (ADP-forming)
MKLIELALKENRSILSEYESKQILQDYAIPVTSEILVSNEEDLINAAGKIGFPLVMKGCSRKIVHKTEKGLIRVDIRNAEEALAAFNEIKAAMDVADKTVLVQQMVKGQRELVVGLTRDPQLGPCVMFGLGGIFTEVLNDTVFRVAPLEKEDALEMMQEIKGRKILDAVRGMAPADKNMLAEILIRVGRIGIENEKIKEIDINPIILSAGKPIAVDALMVLEGN